MGDRATMGLSNDSSGFYRADRIMNALDQTSQEPMHQASQDHRIKSVGDLRQTSAKPLSHCRIRLLRAGKRVFALIAVGTGKPVRLDFLADWKRWMRSSK